MSGRTQKSYRKGWQAAHGSGDAAEKRAVDLSLAAALDHTHPLVRAGLASMGPGRVEAEIVGSKNVESWLGGTCRSKADIEVAVAGNRFGISVKSTETGQAGLHRTETMLETLQRRYGYGYDEKDLAALKLFAGSDENSYKELSRGRTTFTKTADHVGGGSRMTPGNMRAYEKEMFNDLLDWLRLGIVEIAHYVFLQGENSHAADALWYLTKEPAEPEDTSQKHLAPGCAPAGKLSTKPRPIDMIASGQELTSALTLWRNNGGRVTMGPSGSTFTLPFGGLQAHQGKLQFTHNLTLLKKLGVRFS